VKFKIGERVTHPVFGAGSVVDIWLSRKSENIAVKFDKGGPMGFAKDATNDTKDLAQEAS
jgi:hypothetical protein